MIEIIEFNTKEKAEKCLALLKNRGISIITIHYGNKQLSKYLVQYFTTDKPVI